MPLQALQLLEKKIERRIRLFELKNGIRLDDEVRFIRSWIEKPLSIGAVTPSVPPTRPDSAGAPGT